MTPAEINKVATMTERFTKVHLSAQRTNRELHNLNFELFEELITPEEKKALKKANDIIEEIMSRTCQYSVRQYINAAINL